MISSKSGTPPAVNQRDILSAIDRLSARFGSRLTQNQEMRRLHANQTSWHPQQLPDAVLTLCRPKRSPRP